MKYTTIIASVTLGLASLITTGCVGEADVASVSSENYYSHDTDFRDKVRRLRDHYARVQNEAEYHGASRHIRGELVEISEGIDRVASFVFSGQFIPERAQENISRLHSELRSVSDEIRM